ncbi:MAG TPA: endolytic transglycosylase MltG [Candidatus Pseudogracilibacillus intestinigallinarum]|uniref:Endolytic murein transglycosylase n=1 Tax=Candidatus Pseudogracilibacillus intestinigallinarum TaxID=2838742 RepID=A0A9D1PLP1_9BACI|nr:endolytic transglycosylase MltG [Candidatus Pseudogracilibacillus intestinigallinarum]
MSKKQNIEEIVNEAKTVRKIVFILLTALTVLFIAVIAFGFFYIKSTIEPVDKNSTEDIEIEIPLGSSTSNIATILKENDLIKNERVFQFYVKFKNYSDFQAGEYILNQSMTMDDIANNLQTGTVQEEPLFRVTIPEGRNIEQIAEITSKKLKFTEEDFIRTVTDKSFIERMMEEYPSLITDEVLNDDLYMALEGYLFAGTYDIYDEAVTAEELITQMIDRTNDLVINELDAMDEKDFTIHEVLTLASVIERESKFEKDRPKVAQVYINRLDENMKLQSDITAFYGLKNIEHKAVVTYDDIEVDTPYNTYVIDGLPVGPIASPSKEAIDAVLHPEGDDFTKLFYFSRPNGETFYADTLEEHNKIKEKYRQEWYDLENKKDDKKKKDKE